MDWEQSSKCHTGPSGFTYPAPSTLSQIPQVKRKPVPAQLTNRIQRRDAGSGVDLQGGEGGWACKLKELLWRLSMYSCSWTKSKPRSAGSGPLTVGSAARGSPKTQRQVGDWRESSEVVAKHPVVLPRGSETWTCHPNYFPNIKQDSGNTGSETPWEYVTQTKPLLHLSQKRASTITEWEQGLCVGMKLGHLSHFKWPVSSPQQVYWLLLYF